MEGVVPGVKVAAVAEMVVEERDVAVATAMAALVVV